MEKKDLDKPKKVNYVGFNFDSNFFCVGTDIGFDIYETKSDPLELLLSRQLDGGIGLVQILENTNIFGLVGGGENPRFVPNKLIIWNDDKSEIVNEFRCDSFIINCYMKQNCIFIICADNITLINLKTMNIIKNFNTINNPKGISSISNDPKKYILAFPNKDKGSFLVLHFPELEENNQEMAQKLGTLKNNEKSIQAHEGDICVLCLNYEGTKIASASDRGTVIRLFNTKDGTKLGEYRRGTDPANIYSLSFSLDSSLLGLTSDHGTCHIFRLIKPQEDQNTEKSGFMSYLNFGGISKKITNALNYGQDYSWKQFDIPKKNISFLCFNDFKNKEDKKVYVIDKSGNYLSAVLREEKSPKILANKNVLQL